MPTAEAKAAQTTALTELVASAKRDGTRPVTFANIPEHCDEANHACDFLCLNEYAGWQVDRYQRPSRRTVREHQHTSLRYQRPPPTHLCETLCESTSTRVYTSS